jgi:hypothetical protein
MTMTMTARPARLAEVVEEFADLPRELRRVPTPSVRPCTRR